jgi:hypothetical protein
MSLVAYVECRTAVFLPSPSFAARIRDEERN